MRTFLDPRLSISHCDCCALKELGYDYPYWVTVGPRSDPTHVFLGSQKMARVKEAATPWAGTGLLFYYEAGAPLELSEPGDRFLTSEEVKGIVVRAERRAAGWSSGGNRELYLVAKDGESAMPQVAGDHLFVSSPPSIP